MKLTMVQYIMIINMLICSVAGLEADERNIHACEKGDWSTGSELLEDLEFSVQDTDDGIVYYIK